jgi:hypothetical protein
MHLVTTKGAPPRGEATPRCLALPPRVFGDRGPGARAPARCPSEATNRQKRRSCSHERRGGEEGLRSREGRARRCTRPLGRVDTDDDGRPARSRWATSVKPQMTRSLGPSISGADRRRRGRSSLGPCSSSGNVRLGTDSSASREHEGDLGGSRSWPRRSLLTHRRVRPADRAEGERREAPSGRARSATGVRVGGTRSFGTMKDAKHEVAEACLSDPSPSADHESANEQRNRGAQTVWEVSEHAALERSWSSLRGAMRTTRDLWIRCSRRTPFVVRGSRGVKREVSRRLTRVSSSAIAACVP